jgi:hypothetical protein
MAHLRIHGLRARRQLMEVELSPWGACIFAAASFMQRPCLWLPLRCPLGLHRGRTRAACTSADGADLGCLAKLGVRRDLCPRPAEWRSAQEGARRHPARFLLRWPLIR